MGQICIDPSCVATSVGWNEKPGNRNKIYTNDKKSN